MADGPGPEPAWGASPAPAPPAVAELDANLDVDACVIGLGTSGRVAARRLAERGADVVALDAHGIGAGAAGRNGGFLLAGMARFHHDAVVAWGHERAVGLYRWTLDELGRALDELPVEVARRVGSLRIAADDGEVADCDAMLAQLRADGLPAEAYDGPEGRGVFVPTDAAMDPAARCAVLARWALDAGARLAAPAAVTTIEDGVVHLAGGMRLSARCGVIVAVDGGLERLLPELAGRVTSVRLQMLATAPDRGVSLPRPVYRRWGYDYVQQRATGEVFLGGFRDRGAAEEGAPPVPSDDVQACLDAELARLGVTAPVTHRWAAQAAFTDDLLPVCERVRPGVLAVGGYSGHGNVVGTACARLAADALLDGTPLALPA